MANLKVIFSFALLLLLISGCAKQPSSNDCREPFQWGELSCCIDGKDKVICCSEHDTNGACKTYSEANIVENYCIFPVQINCMGLTILPSSLRLVIFNGAGRDMNITGIYASSEAIETGNAKDACSLEPSSPVLIKNQERQTFELSHLQFSSSPCTYRENGRNKHGYNITVSYRWDAPNADPHNITGHALATKSK